ncbi:unnamed protein product [Symbiodinium pilosum]|uniref:Uncharacterized protein n=1 Tax=Symbiodinium pilosum TaxID=2952 RepID=A0A812XY46_SYMPI|nr:unnamed protein product [Symbiodinium pilosum]
MLTPNAVTTSLEESAKVVDRSQDKGLVVITSRLILQPNSGHRQQPPGQPEVVDCEKAGPVSAAEKKAEEAYQKKMDLLAEMTKELQVILQRLSDKNLCDSTRERYQTLAQTIQNRMSSLSRPYFSEKPEKSYQPAAAGSGSGNSPPMSPASPPAMPVPALSTASTTALPASPAFGAVPVAASAPAQSLPEVVTI